MNEQTDNKPRILVVDDNPTNIRMVRSMLSDTPYEIFEAHNGLEALENVVEIAPDLIITDVIMPKMDGFTLVKSLRETPDGDAIPVLMVTSLHELKIKLKGLEAGADDFLTKPFISVELQARVRSLLRIKLLHDELETKNKVLARVLTRYISEDIAKLILSDPDQNLRLGGESCEASILFADIRGFTDFSELHSPSHVTAMLNRIFQVLTEPIFQFDGTLDKYLGDAVMAFYGAPVPTDDHAERALYTAWLMQDRFRQLREQHEDMQSLGLGVGICTGEVIVGNIGSERLMDYTVIGQTVNMAKRLQEHAKATQILIEERTYQAIQEHIEARRVDVPVLQEYRQLSQIYEIVALHDPQMRHL